MTNLAEIAKNSVEAFNTRDWDRWSSLHVPNTVYDEVATGRRLTGHAEITEAMKGWASAFSDARGTVTSTLVQGDTVVLEVTWSGTHDGPLHGPTGLIPPSGRSTNTRAVQLLKISEGLIVENRQYFDMLEMLIQIGAISTTEAETAEA